MLNRVGHIVTGGALALFIGLTAAGCGQQQAAQAAPPAQTTQAAQTTQTTQTAQTTNADTGASTAPAADVPLLAVVSPAKEGPCVVTTQYQHGSHIVFRIQILEPATGEQLTGKDLSAVSVVLPDGTKLPAKFGTHEGGKIPFWTASWTVPANYPTGQVNYTIAAQGTNRKVEQVKFDVPDPAAHLTVLKGTATDEGA